MLARRARKRCPAQRRCVSLGSVKGRKREGRWKRTEKLLFAECAAPPKYGLDPTSPSSPLRPPSPTANELRFARSAFFEACLREAVALAGPRKERQRTVDARGSLESQRERRGRTKDGNEELFVEHCTGRKERRVSTRKKEESRKERTLEPLTVPPHPPQPLRERLFTSRRRRRRRRRR